MKALGYREDDDREVVFSKLNEMYGESRCCDHCSLEILGLHNADALFINRTQSWMLVHTLPCALDVVQAENVAIAAMQQVEDAA
jgi:hypothetical protein